MTSSEMSSELSEDDKEAVREFIRRFREFPSSSQNKLVAIMEHDHHHISARHEGEPKYTLMRRPEWPDESGMPEWAIVCETSGCDWGWWEHSGDVQSDEV
jgi:hypothetical protein